MAKKKAKKKAKAKKKSKRKSTKKARHNPLKDSIRIKIARIRDSMPCVEPTGECRDPDTNELLFKFTEAQKVFTLYRQLCQAEGLIYRPYFAVGIQPTIVPIGRGVALVAPFCIEDTATGEILVGWGTGMGMNADWSGNTAGTRALKQFLLTTFQSTWQDPEDLSRSEQKELLKAEVVKELEADGTLAKIEMLKFFGQPIKKGKNDVKNTRKSDTTKRPRSRSQGNRTKS